MVYGAMRSVYLSMTALQRIANQACDSELRNDVADGAI